MIGKLFDGILEAICKLLILMVAGIYKLVSGAYQIFLVLSKTNIFEQDSYAHLTDKVYIILAVTMLFVVAYTFITLIIDPDKNKGGKAIEDLIKKSVTSLILIVLCPTLFTIAFDLQDAIMDQDVIGKFFTTETESSTDTNTSIKKGGNLMAGTTFAAFFYPSFESTDPASIKNKSEGKHLKIDGNEIDCSKENSCSLQEAVDFVTETGKFGVFTAFAENWADGDQQSSSVDFNMLLAMIAGGYLLFVIISFCFDLAIRVIKLAFYQIIAPICIACRVLPKKESIFTNWWKAVSKTYLSVFIRVFIMNLAVFLMVELTKHNFWGNICDPEEMECGGAIKFLAYAFLIMGLVTFIKQSSKLIDEIFGLGDVKLGITDKLKEGGGFAATSIARSGVHGTAAGFKNGIPSRDKWKNMGAGQKVGSIIKATGRGALVGAGAMARSLGSATGGFGTDKFIKEMEKTTTESKLAAKKSEIAMERLAQKPAEIKQMIKDLPEYIKSRAKIKELELDLDSANIEMDRLKAELEKVKATGEAKAIADAEARLSQAQKRIEDAKLARKQFDQKAEEKKKAWEAAKEHLNKLTLAGADSSVLAEAQQKVNERYQEYMDWQNNQQEINRLDSAIQTAESEKLNAQSLLQEEKRKYANKYKVTYEEAIGKAKADIDAQEAIIKGIEESLTTAQKSLGDIELTNVISNIQDSINKYCFQNPNGILELLDEGLDGITKKVEKVASKYNHAISINFEAALKKNTLLSSLPQDKRDALLNDDRFKLGVASVQSIEAISRSLKNATTYAQVKEILGDNLCNELGIDSNNFNKFQQAFVDTIDNPYHKEVIKATADAINGVPNSNIYITSSQRSQVIGDRDSEDARAQEFNYQVIYESIYGKGTGAKDVRSYSKKKDKQDQLRDASRSGQKHDIRKKAQEKVFGVNTEDK